MNIKKNLKILKNGIQNYYLKIVYSTKDTQIGKNVSLEHYISIYKSGEGVSIGDNSKIKKWVVLNPWGGKIVIGKNCSLNSFVHISGNGGVYIGDNVLLATQVVIISANHNFDRVDIPICKQGETRKKIIIEDDCWIGAGAKILAGVTIGKGSVIGAGCVVTRDVPQYSVVVGVPGRVVKSRIKTF